MVEDLDSKLVCDSKFFFLSQEDAVAQVTWLSQGANYRQTYVLPMTGWIVVDTGATTSRRASCRRYLVNLELPVCLLV